MLQIWFHIINLYTSIRSTTKWNKKTDRQIFCLFVDETNERRDIEPSRKKKTFNFRWRKRIFRLLFVSPFQNFPVNTSCEYRENQKKKEEKLFSQRDTNEIFHVEWRWRKKLKHHSCVELSERQDEATKLCLPLRLFILSFICRLTMT